MANLILNGSTSGSVTLSSPAVSGTTTLTLPATTGTVMVNGPAFSAYQSSAQSFANGTITKVQYQTEEFDTASAFDSTTNYRFTPLISGYYQINASISWNGTTAGYALAYIYKNGASYKAGNLGTGNAAGQLCIVSSIVFLNGSTDYIEIYAQQGFGSSQNSGATSSTVYVNGCMVRGA
jgi:hypothetical protein